jgi:hypothetical protein
VTAPELYAISQGRRCKGPHRCHWCASPCESGVAADDPVHPFVRRAVFAACPSEPWQCVGCTLFKMRRVTVLHLDGGFTDRQCPEEHSWLITREGAHALDFRDPESVETLRTTLLRPPCEFVLTLRAGAGKNFLHLAKANVNAEVKADTRLAYTVDGTTFFYTPHQLAAASKDPEKAQGFEAGALDLTGRLGPWASRPAEATPPKRGRGRPPGRVADVGTEESRERDRQTKPLRLSGVGAV